MSNRDMMRLKRKAHKAMETLVRLTKIRIRTVVASPEYMAALKHAADSWEYYEGRRGNRRLCMK